MKRQTQQAPNSDLAELTALAQLYNLQAAPQLQRDAQSASEEDRKFQGVLALLGLQAHSTDANAQRALQQAQLAQTGEMHTGDMAQRAREFETGQATTNRGLDLQSSTAQAELADRAAGRTQQGQQFGEQLASTGMQHNHAVNSQVLQTLLASPSIDPSLHAPLIKTLFPEAAQPFNDFQSQQDEALVGKLLPAFTGAHDDQSRAAILSAVPPNLQGRFKTAQPIQAPPTSFSQQDDLQRQLRGLPAKANDRPSWWPF